MSWYPLGRPIGTTIYPGMQITAVAIWKLMQNCPKMVFKVPLWLRKQVPGLMKKLRFGPMSVNGTCVYTPAFFAVFATIGVFLLTKEISRKSNSYTAAAVAAGI